LSLGAGRWPDRALVALALALWTYDGNTLDPGRLLIPGSSLSQNKIGEPVYSCYHPPAPGRELRAGNWRLGSHLAGLEIALGLRQNRLPVAM
jgi:hypothetical protein